MATDYSALLEQSPELLDRYKKNLRHYDRDGGEWALEQALNSPLEPVVVPKSSTPAKVSEADKIQWASNIELRNRLISKKERDDADNQRIKDADAAIKSFETKYSPVKPNPEAKLNPVPRDTPDAPPVYVHRFGLLGGTTELNPNYSAWKINKLKDTIASGIAPLPATPKKKPLIYIDGSNLSNATRAEADARWLLDNPISTITSPAPVIAAKTKIRRWNPEKEMLE